ncbi:P-loop containing nucleoside triphosphate hydrolase protein [Zopfochytrium polystomum]|nr:P-loop containing nucleoside triphosphate hydrolase protein [Zopfochytrium polystomum]
MHYNIDGSLRKETEEERLARVTAETRADGSSWRKHIPAIQPDSKPALIAEAIKSMAPGPAGSESSPTLDNGNVSVSLAGVNGLRVGGPALWGFLADKVLFGKEGEASFRRHTGEYDEFCEFFRKFKSMRQKKQTTKASHSEIEEVSVARQALVLFGAYQEKRKKSLSEKITKDRASLPIKEFETNIIESVQRHRVVLIAADTGAGKSTQVPQYLLAAGFDKIACTQPRRIACYSLARRVSYESLNIYGSEIAYQVRFEGTKTSNTRILFLTEGLLLRQFASDPMLSSYNVIIVDEVHERHVTGDFLLGVLKQLLSRRDDVRVVLMSATINAELFSKYFSAPVIEVPGRMYPVKIEYRPIEEEDKNLVDDRFIRERERMNERVSIPAKSGKLKAEPYLRIMERIDETIPAHERGDLLVFFPFGDRAGKGKVKEMSYDASSHLSRLSEFWISKSSAKQRAGRAGRTGPGEVCFRFYSQREFEGLNDFPVPEILRTPLEALLLQVRAYGLGNPRLFDFIEKPAASALCSSVARLTQLKALDEREELTSLGKVLAELPMDVVLGKMLILGSVKRSPLENIGVNALARQALHSPLGDPMTLVSLFSEWLKVKADGNESSRSWCRRRGIEEQRLYEMVKLKSQFEEIFADYVASPEESYSSCESDGSDNTDRRVHTVGQKRKRGIVTATDVQRSSRLRFWKDPEYIDKRNKKILLERQKREQVSGKRKILRLGDDEDVATEGQSESACSQEKNPTFCDLFAAPGFILTLQFRTKQMLCGPTPNSVFAVDPELLHPSVDFLPEAPQSSETLDSIRPRPKMKELLCYQELIETNKPYLKNVLRVPAGPACILFAQKLDVSGDLRHIIVDDWLHLSYRDREQAELSLVLGNWLRCGWELIINRRLENLQRSIARRRGTNRNSRDVTLDEYPTPSAVDSTLENAESAGQRVLTDWSDFPFLTLAVQRMRSDWESVTTWCKAAPCGDFEEISDADLSGKP